MKALASFLLIAASTLFAFGLLEAGYRFILKQDVPERFAYADVGMIQAFDVSHWNFDQKFGYGYPPKRKIAHTAITDGKVASCTLIDVINERGNIGPIEGSYEDAELKIAIFGDSWSAFNQNSLTWTDILQRKLEKFTGKSTHVVNFGRDGYGLLQMFDLSVHELPKWKPDIAVYAFITNDLARVRTWRVIEERDGQEDRILTTFQPSADPDISTTYDTFLVHGAATHEWCLSAKASGERDSVIEALERKYQRARRPGGAQPANIMATNVSYLWNRVRHGDPFKNIPDKFSFPSLTIDSYAEDEQFVEAVKAAKADPADKLLFHMAFYPEVIAREEYILNFREERLLNSLLDITGMPVIETLANVTLPLENPERMNSSPDNFHPSLWGMEFYADVFIKGLVKQGLISPAPPK